LSPSGDEPLNINPIADPGYPAYLCLERAHYDRKRNSAEIHRLLQVKGTRDLALGVSGSGE
jgi:hypothetical protein